MFWSTAPSTNILRSKNFYKATIIEGNKKWELIHSFALLPKWSLLYNVHTDIRYLQTRWNFPIVLHLTPDTPLFGSLHSVITMLCRSVYHRLSTGDVFSEAPSLVPNALACPPGLAGIDSPKTVEEGTQHFKRLRLYLVLRWGLPLPYKFCPCTRLLWYLSLQPELHSESQRQGDGGSSVSGSNWCFSQIES